MISERLLSVAKKVIISGVKLGFDEAGSRLLGPTAWKYFKKLLTPIIDELTEQFPNLVFGKPDDKEAMNVGAEAVKYLSENENLKKMLSDGFYQSKIGQNDILQGINKLDKKFEKLETGIEEIKELIHETLHQNVEKNKLPQTVPEWLDLSEIIKHYEVILNEQFGHIDDPDKRNAIIKATVYRIAIYEYRQIIMEKGESNKLYKYKLFKAEHTFRASGDYTNELGQKCRRYHHTGPNLPELGDYKTKLTTGKMCKIEGRWEESSG